MATRADGRLVREPVGRNRKFADRALTKTQHEIDEDTYEAPRKVTFRDWADQWLNGLRRRSTTKDAYAVTLAYAKTSFGPKLLRRLTSADIRAFLDLIERENRRRNSRARSEQARNREISAATLAKHLRQLSACLEAARTEGLLPENPVSRLHKSARPKAGKKRPSYFTDEELRRLWPELADREPYLFAAKFASTTGMRFGEIAGLRLSDVSLLDREVQIYRQWTAGEEVDITKDADPRTVDLVPGAQEVLEAWLQLRGLGDGLLFTREVGGHLDNDEARDLLYAAMGRAGIPRVGEGGRKRDFHSLRHTFARVALENGALLQWVQGQMGHSTVTLTADLYGRWSRKGKKTEAAKLKGAFPV